MFRSLLSLPVVAMLVLGSVAISADTVRAGDCPPVYVVKCVTVYETVVVCETQKVPYTKTVTLYDHCGRAYDVTQTCYREVQVAVKKQVPVQKKVLVRVSD